MSLNRPILDDRSYEQLRDELVRRIPVYAPEWTDHNASDPGITLIELFSYLGENLLYRFNQIPEATQLEFLRLLQIPLRPAQPARSVVAMTTKEMAGVPVAMGSVAVAGDVAFETLTEVRALPVTAIAVSKEEANTPDEGSDEEAFFKQAYQAAEVESADDAVPYQSTLVWEENQGLPVDFDKAADSMMWVAVLAEDADKRDFALEALADHDDAPLLLNLGFIPDIQISEEDEIGSQTFANRFRCPGEGNSDTGPAVQWQISTATLNGEDVPQYQNISVEGDSSDGLSREGVVRLRLPRDLDEMGPFEIEDPDLIGTGDFPPPLDDELEERLLFWLRAFRLDKSDFGKVVYVGANATEVVQTVKARAEFLGTGDGQPNQSFALINKQIVPGTLVLEVEDASGWRAWQAVEGFHASNESDLHYTLDAAVGRVKFGNGLQGYAPQIGQRIRVTSYRYGGGVQGNVAPEAISKLKPIKAVKLSNPLAAYGGAEAEKIEKALDRIPGELRRRDRAVTQSDFKELALMTPGANIGRSECLPRFDPATLNDKAAGVVTVVVWPTEDSQHPDAPVPNKNQLRLVCQWLDARRLVTTEHYVIAPTYRPLSVAVGLVVKPGYGVDAVRHWVELVIRQYLAPLPPYGPSGEGWPLGRRVHGPELEAAALQVEGVEYLTGLKIAANDGENRTGDGAETVMLELYEVPELKSISVEEGAITVDPADATGIESPGMDKSPVPIPVVQEVC